MRVFVNILLELILLISVSCGEMGYGDEIYCNYPLGGKKKKANAEVFRVDVFN